MPETNPNSPQLNRDQAQLICDSFEIHAFFDDEEEVELMEKHNPDLLRAYEVLRAIADGDDG